MCRTSTLDREGLTAYTPQLRAPERTIHQLSSAKTTPTSQIAGNTYPAPSALGERENTQIPAPFWCSTTAVTLSNALTLTVHRHHSASAHSHSNTFQRLGRHVLSLSLSHCSRGLAHENPTEPAFGLIQEHTHTHMFFCTLQYELDFQHPENPQYPWTTTTGS